MYIRFDLPVQEHRPFPSSQSMTWRKGAILMTVPLDCRFMLTKCLSAFCHCAVMKHLAVVFQRRLRTLEGWTSSHIITGSFSYLRLYWRPFSEKKLFPSSEISCSIFSANEISKKCFFEFQSCSNKQWSFVFIFSMYTEVPG